MGSRSGTDIRADFQNGRPVSWRFNRNQSRLSITLPKLVGGRTVEVVFEGGYTFTPLVAQELVAEGSASRTHAEL